MRNTNVIIVTDDTEFAQALSSGWRVEKLSPEIRVVNIARWKKKDIPPHELVIVGPAGGETILGLVPRSNKSCPVIFCGEIEARELGQILSHQPRILHIPQRENWVQMVVLVANESLRRAEALRRMSEAERTAARNERDATLGRYMMEMKHGINNALTSILGNAELLQLEPGQLSTQSLSQIKTIHSMAMRLNEVMQRFSSLANEMQEAEKYSQAETRESEFLQPTQQ